MDKNSATDILLRPLTDWAPPPSPSVEAPTPSRLLGDLDAPAWLTDPLLAAAAGDDPYAAFAAAGTVGRLWAPRGTGASAAEALARLVADDDPMARASRWAKALPAAVFEHLLSLVDVEVSWLTDEIDELADADLAPDDLAAAAGSWLARRDDLASVLRLLGPRAAGLSCAVESLDRLGRTHASLWALAAPALTPRLAAVAWQEPDAWWATVAR